MKTDNQIFSLTGMALVLLNVIPYLTLFTTFAITDSDFIYDGEVTLISSTYSPSNDSIAFSWVSGANHAMENGTIFYTIGESNDTLSSIPNPEGTNVINKFAINATTPTTIVLSKWHTVYTREVVQNITINQTIVYVEQNATSTQLCTGFGGAYTNLTCTCPNGVKWYDNSTSKVCGPVTTTVTEKIGPSFWSKYGGPGIIFIVLGSIILYLIFKRSR